MLQQLRFLSWSDEAFCPVWCRFKVTLNYRLNDQSRSYFLQIHVHTPNFLSTTQFHWSTRAKTEAHSCISTLKWTLRGHFVMQEILIRKYQISGGKNDPRQIHFTPFKSDESFRVLWLFISPGTNGLQSQSQKLCGKVTKNTNYSAVAFDFRELFFSTRQMDTFRCIA